MQHERQNMHTPQREGGVIQGRGGGGCHVTHSSHNSTYILLFFLFLIQNIPKSINYIKKYLVSHL